MKNIEIKELLPKQVTSEYVSWLKDPEITKYSDLQYLDINIEKQVDYVKSMNMSENNILFGIFFSKKHIGNVLLKSINLNHHRAEISYLIGCRSLWGKGIASYAISFVCEYAKSEIKLHRLFAGVAQHNKASQKTLLKNGFILEGKRKNHLKFNDSFVNQLDYGKKL